MTYISWLIAWASWSSSASILTLFELLKTIESPAKFCLVLVRLSIVVAMLHALLWGYGNVSSDRRNRSNHALIKLGLC